MFKTKYKENKLINSNLLLFTVFCLCGILYLGFITNYWYLLLLLLIPLTIRNVKLRPSQIIILSSILIIFIVLIICANQFSLINLINSGIRKIGGNHVRKAIISFLDDHYSKETSSFIKLVLLNIKSKDTYIFHKQAVDLGIVWLICISGFHISLISKLIQLIFKKIPIVGKYVNIVILSFYSYVLNFTYASIRVVLNISYSWVFKRFDIQRYEKIGLVGLTIGLLNPSCFANYGFLLSFIVCIAANYVSSLQLNNKIITSLLINIFAFISTIPFVVDMNHKISLLSFINAFVFTYFSSIIFLYFLIFSWMPFMATIHRGIIVASYVLVGNISFSNIYIYSGDWPAWVNSLYYLTSVGLGKALYLIVYNNKI